MSLFYRLNASACLVLISLHQPVSAINKCVDESGVSTYSDRPCDKPDKGKSVSDREMQSLLEKQSDRNRKLLLQAQQEADEFMRQELINGKKRNADAQAKKKVETKSTEDFKHQVISKEPMSFQKCWQKQTMFLADWPTATIIRIVHAPPFATVTRICTIDGSVLLTCSEDGMLLSKSSRFQGDQCP